MKLLRTWRGRLAALALLLVAPAIVFSDVVPEPPVRLLRALLDAGNANRIVVNNGSGVMTDAAAITANRLLRSNASGIPIAHDAITASRVLLSDPNGMPIAHGGLTANRLVVSGATGLLDVNAALTPNRALMVDGSGFPTVSNVVDNTELSYLDGVSSSIQNQINGLSSALTLLATYTPSAVASVDITSQISATYDNYLLVAALKPAADNNDLLLRVDTDNGASWESTLYSGSGVVMHASSSTVGAIASGTNAGGAHIATGLGNGAGQAVVAFISIYRGNGTIPPSIFSQSIGDMSTNDSSTRYGSIASKWNGLVAINAVQLIFNTGNITSGTAKFYGIKN